MMELKSCPFCGNKYISVVPSVDKRFYWCKCEECGVSTECFNEKQKAIDFWNRRAETMAKEYIEREALIDEINIAPVSMSVCMNVDECKGRIYERERLLRIINAVPAADVRPVVKATWIRCNGGAGFKCSACKARVSNADVVNGNHRFCYKCGAMMEES